MDWITGIQRALDYTEAHLLEDIDYEAVAKQACSSAFHFQRMFAMLCGYTLGEYIRMRRLALSADELVRTGDKVIDVALKYGYDTPESFTRAFTRFHGISPTQARRGGTVKSFSRLSVKLTLSGGICTEFFPQSNYEYGNGVELEVYPSDNVGDGDYACEIWIAVTEKK